MNNILNMIDGINESLMASAVKLFAFSLYLFLLIWGRITVPIEKEINVNIVRRGNA